MRVRVMKTPYPIKARVSFRNVCSRTFGLTKEIRRPQLHRQQLLHLTELLFTSGPDSAECSLESQENASTAASSPHAPSIRTPKTPTSSIVSINSTEDDASVPRLAARTEAAPEPNAKPPVCLPGSPNASSEKKPEYLCRWQCRYYDSSRETRQKKMSW